MNDIQTKGLRRYVGTDGHIYHKHLDREQIDHVDCWCLRRPKRKK